MFAHRYATNTHNIEFVGKLLLVSGGWFFFSPGALASGVRNATCYVPGREGLPQLTFPTEPGVISSVLGEVFFFILPVL